MDLKFGKAPGSDGLTANFYKQFSDLLAPILYKVFNDAFQHKTLTTTQYLAIIILLFKRGHQQMLTNYRPISLTNVDYKILAYILTAHLSDQLPFFDLS